MSSPLSLYRARSQQPGFVFDPVQEMAAQHLERVYADLLAEQQKRRYRWLPLGKAAPVKGLYMWGGVGRGKTYLMDLFFESLPFTEKLRIHFHRFMQNINEELRMLRGEKDPLKGVAKKIASTAKVLCFDEFVVNDVGDAIILGNLLEALFQEGVCLVTTSNLPPDELYKEGLQRELFLPAIAKIKANTEVINVDAGVDYRWRHLSPSQHYYAPLPGEREFMQAHFNGLSCGRSGDELPIEIAERYIPVVRKSPQVLWFEFAVICGEGRGTLDYITIAKSYGSVLISNIPQLSGEMDDFARRFINLVDEFYDARLNLILSSTVPMQHLYTGSKLAFEFQRTLSRLQEMQSEEYWRQSKAYEEPTK